MSNRRVKNVSNRNVRTRKQAAPEIAEGNGVNIPNNGASVTNFGSFEAYTAARNQLQEQGFSRLSVGWSLGEGEFTGTVAPNDDGELYGLLVITSNDRQNFIDLVYVTDVTDEEGTTHGGQFSVSFENFEPQDGDEIEISASNGKNGRTYARMTGIVAE